MPLEGTRKARSVAARSAAVGVLTAGMVISAGPGWAAAGNGLPTSVPSASVRLPAAVEDVSPYLPQVSCDPNPKPGVAAFEQMMLATFRRGSSGGITRACDAPGVAGGRSEHKEGRAWDWMLDPNSYEDLYAGNRAVDWLLADGAVNARRLGLMYLIWNRRIWSAHDAQVGWRGYDYGDPHTSHIHFSFSWAGAEKRTSWWTGKVAPVEYGPCRVFADQPVPPYGDEVNLRRCPAPARARSHGKVVFTSAASAAPTDPAQAADPDSAPNDAAPAAAPATPGEGRSRPVLSTAGRERCTGTCKCC
ncbi:MAG TPA: hypothetical protein VHV82_15320 [Sporichthyaceae bacterium]|jgi:hypothetical protein|nr:hypothetical protein [Sporichthyaceae bacterium]